MDSLPILLKEPPSPVVAATGLYQNEAPSALAGTFLMALTGPRRLHVLSVPVDHRWPRRKEKRLSYEGYQPEGILKSNWIDKHRSQLPATVAVFLPFGDAAAEEIASTRVDAIRSDATLRSRGIKLLWVIVLSDRRATDDDPSQSTSADPLGAAVAQKEVLTDDERVGDFRRRFGLESKSVVIVRVGTEKAQALRLEQALFDLAVAYYRDEARRVKKNKHDVNQQLQPALFTRHHFKVGFYAELRRDTDNALKYYRSSYGHLLHVPRTEERSMEVKAVAEHIHHKLIALLLRQRATGEAVTQFQRHIAQFRNYVGPAPLAYQHWLWLSRQYQSMGEALEPLFSSGSPPGERPYHPGTYFHTASSYAITRRSVALSLPTPASTATPVPLFNPVGLGGQGQMYVGIDRRPVNIEGLLATELTTNHTANVISLLQAAYTQFTRFRADRMLLYLAVLMGKEYLIANDAASASRLLGIAAKEYRRDAWWVMLADVLSQLVECAALSADTETVVRTLLELLSLRVSVSKADKAKRSERWLRLLAVVQSPASVAPPLPSLRDSVVLPLDLLQSPVACSIAFTATSVLVHQETSLVITFRSDLPVPIAVDNVSVSVSDKRLNRQSPGFTLEPESQHALSFALPCTEPGMFWVNRVSLIIGTPPNAIMLTWNPSSATVQVNSPPAKLAIKVENSPPALVDESHRITLVLNSNGDAVVDGRLALAVEPPLPEVPGWGLFWENGDALVAVEGSVPIAPMDKESTCRIPIRVRSPRAGAHHLIVNATYETDQHYTTTTTVSQPLPVQIPLNAAFHFLSPDLQSLATSGSGSIVVGEQFALVVDLTCATPYPLSLHSVDLLVSNVRLVSSSHHTKVVLGSGDQFTACFVLEALVAGRDVRMGRLRVHWSRYDSEDDCRMLTAVPPTKVAEPTITTELLRGAWAVSGVPLALTLVIHNHTQLQQEVEVKVKDSEDFLMSGYRGATFYLPPRGSERAVFSVWPLRGGRRALPAFQVVSKRWEAMLPQTRQPRSIFVRPAGSDMSELPEGVVVVRSVGEEDVDVEEEAEDEVEEAKEEVVAVVAQDVVDVGVEESRTIVEDVEGEDELREGNLDGEGMIVDEDDDA